ncbi:MAG TPA: MerR family transcriptional regulator [Gaiellales bacterium]
MNEAPPSRSLRIGELAARTGTTPRTIRYYEEVGLLPARSSEAKGTHRLYDEGDVETLDSLVRLRELLGLSLDDLRTLISAESARAGLRRAFGESEDRPDERERILHEARGHIETQLTLLRARRETIAQLEAELVERLERVALRLAELDLERAQSYSSMRPSSAPTPAAPAT